MNWNKFLFYALPLVLIGAGGVLEVVARGLDSVPPRRHDLDLLVAAIGRQPSSASVVLMGDSVTQDVMKTYAVASPGRVANLTTNQASGMIGAALLLRRYLETNSAPRVLLIAATPEFHAYQPEGAAARTYLTSVFRRSEEQKLMADAGIDIREDWHPAAFSLEKRIAEPVSGLLAPLPHGIPTGTRIPDEVPYTEPGPALPGVARQIEHRASRSLSLSESAKFAWQDVCDQAMTNGFDIQVVRAPVPESVRRKRGQGWEPELMHGIMSACPKALFGDVNDSDKFPDYAFRDADHLQRPGWTAYYARVLTAYVNRLQMTGNR